MSVPFSYDCSRMLSLLSDSGLVALWRQSANPTKCRSIDSPTIDCLSPQFRVKVDFPHIEIGSIPQSEKEIPTTLIRFITIVRVATFMIPFSRFPCDRCKSAKDIIRDVFDPSVCDRRCDGHSNTLAIVQDITNNVEENVVNLNKIGIHQK